MDPLEVDVIDHGKLSDQKCSILYPVDNSPTDRTAEYSTRFVRPLPASKLLNFRNALRQTDFGPVIMAEDTDQADERLLGILRSYMITHLPEKKLKFRPSDKLFITPELKVLDRQRKREYAKHGKTLKFTNLKSKFDFLYKKAAKDFLFKNVDQLRKCKPGRAHRTLRRMGARPGEDTESSAFSIPEIRDGGLSDQEAANLIGDFFSRISQQHAPLDLNKLPLPVRDAILTFNVEDIP